MREIVSSIQQSGLLISKVRGAGEGEGEGVVDFVYINGIAIQDLIFARVPVYWEGPQ